MARKYNAIIEYFKRNKDQIITGKGIGKGLVSMVNTEERINNCLFKYQV